MNDKHYEAGAPGGKGGQFAPKGAGTGGVTNSSISYVPGITSSGQKRTFFVDLPEEQQRAVEKEYEEKHHDLDMQAKYLYDTNKTSKIDTPARKLLREKILNDEFTSQMQKGHKNQERRATLLIGLPGSGKSTIANPLSDKMGAFIIDADEFKKRIPEFQQDKRMVSAVHHESVNLANDFINALSKEGYNMIVGKVGGDYDSVRYILDDLMAKGYKIDVVLNDVPFDVALDRTIGRFDRGETNRIVPFWTLKVADKNIFNTFDQVLKHPAITGGKIYSNDVEKGQSPILLKEFTKDED